MKRSLVLLFSLIAIAGLSGCETSNNTNNVIKGVGPISVPELRNFTTTELVIGRRICNALKNKRELFETLRDMQEKFSFVGEQKNCGNPNPAYVTEFMASVSNSNSTDFEYISTTQRPNYFRDVVTDQNGVMKLLCDDLSRSNTISNQMLSGSSYLRVNLLIKGGFDRFEVTKQSKDTNGNYNFISSESVSVITQTSQAATKFFGVEQERIKNTPCPNSSEDYASLRQTWRGALTSF